MRHKRTCCCTTWCESGPSTSDPEDGTLPSHMLRSELLNGMLQACGKTGVVVLHAERGMGKSTAAKYMFKHTRRGETLLVAAVAAVTGPEKALETNSWIDRLMQISRSICGGNEDDDNSSQQVIPSIPGLDLSFLQKKPMIIFEDFNDVGEEDIKFMKSLYPIVKAKNVLLFVLVRDEHTANRLIKLNNWGRIAPLPAICRNTVHRSSARQGENTSMEADYVDASPA